MEVGVNPQRGFQQREPELDIPPLQSEGVQFKATFSESMMSELTYTAGPSSQPSFTNRNSLLYQNTQPFYVVTLVKKNQRKSHYGFCNIPGIVLKDWLMKIVNTRINELFLFKSLSEKQYVNNVKLSKRN